MKEMNIKKEKLRQADAAKRKNRRRLGNNFLKGEGKQGKNSKQNKGIRQVRNNKDKKHIYRHSKE